MQAKRKFLSYDWVKLIVALLLLVIIFVLRLKLKNSTKVTTIPEEVAQEEVVKDDKADQGEAETEETGSSESEASVETEEEEVSPSDSSDEDESPPQEAEEQDQESPSAPSFPEIPEPNKTLSVDTDTEMVLDAEGKPLYHLNGDRTSWVPVIPEDFASFGEISSTDWYEWALLAEDGSVSYFWDTSTHAWVQPFVAVEQDQKTGDTTSMGESGGEIEDCPKALPSRITPGDDVKVLTYLNFRSSPDFNEDNLLLALKPGTQVTALGKTVCTEYNLDYILMWQVEIEVGTVGWVAEGSTTQNEYFLEPVGNQ